MEFKNAFKLKKKNVFKEPTRGQEKESRGTKNKKENNKMADITPNISIITLNVSDLNTPVRDRQNG